MKLGKGASALVYCGGQYKTIKDTEKAELSSICSNAPATQRMDIDHDLGEMIMAAVDMVAVAKARGDGWVRGVTDPKKGGDGWGTGVTDPKKGSDGWGTGVTDPKKGSDGWGGKGSSIRLVMPFGLVQKGRVCFSWSKPETKDPYRLEILDEKGTLVHAQSTLDTFLCIDLAGINLMPDRPYSWHVKVIGAKNLLSNDLIFGVGQEKDREEVLKYASYSNNAGNPELLALSKAIALEKEDWFYDAQLIYSDLQKTNPSNLVKIMHAAFWKRYGYGLLSEKVARGN
ncbi:MAG TPA: hypothetical protein VK168_10440 [Saprospiraceae bacterium]|nr:hypothetical protein [Saprospiraceae bacterium]